MSTFVKLLGVVLANALVQALLVLGDPLPAWNLWFVLLVLASFVALTFTLWVINSVLAADWGWRSFAGVIAMLILAAGVGIVVPVLTPLLLTIGIALVCCTANRVNPLTLVRERPTRTAIAAVGTLIGLVLLGVAAVGLGFLVAGAPGAFLTWVVAGAAYVSFVRVWTVKFSGTSPIVRV